MKEIVPIKYEIKSESLGQLKEQAQDLLALQIKYRTEEQDSAKNRLYASIELGIVLIKIRDKISGGFASWCDQHRFTKTNAYQCMKLAEHKDKIEKAESIAQALKLLPKDRDKDSKPKPNSKTPAQKQPTPSTRSHANVVKQKTNIAGRNVSDRINSLVEQHKTVCSTLRSLVRSFREGDICRDDIRLCLDKIASLEKCMEQYRAEELSYDQEEEE